MDSCLKEFRMQGDAEGGCGCVQGDAAVGVGMRAVDTWAAAVCQEPELAG